MPAIPQPTLDEMDLAYHRGADAHKRAIETAVLSGPKISDKQIVHLFAFCDVRPDEEDILPEIWKNIQTTISWYDAEVGLTKWFTEKISDENMDVQFHKELVDIFKK